MTPVRRVAVSATIAAAISAAALAASVAAAPHASTRTLMTAALKSETSGAAVRGRFYARVARYGGDRAQLHFNLTYSPAHESSGFQWPYPGVAHIHLGRPSEPGRVVITLCTASSRCGFGLVWSESFAFDLVGRMRSRGAYVELHPRQSLEWDTLRGQIVFR